MCTIYYNIIYDIINYHLHLCVMRIGTIYTLDDDIILYTIAAA